MKASDWFKTLAPLFHPIRSKTKANRDSLVRVFPHFASVTCNYFVFWLVPLIICVLCDWLEWLLWFWSYDTQLKTALSYANFGKHEKRRLNAVQLENTTALSFSQCCAKCLPNKNCFSVNFGGIGRNECHLLSANKFQPSDQLTTDENLQHFSVVVSTMFV